MLYGPVCTLLKLPKGQCQPYCLSEKRTVQTEGVKMSESTWCITTCPRVSGRGRRKHMQPSSGSYQQTTGPSVTLTQLHTASLAPLLRVHAQTQPHAYTYIHTVTCTHILHNSTHMHTHILTPHTYTHIHNYMHTCTCVFPHAHTHKHTHTETLVRLQR